MGKRICAFCIMNHDGDVLESGKYRNTVVDASRFADRASKRYGSCSAVFESTANMWVKTERALRRYGIPYKMANPLRLKMAQTGLKTDKIDAERLATHLRTNNVPESYVYPENDRYVLNILNDRTNQVRAKTRIINRQHSILDKYDYKIKDSGTLDMTSVKCQNYLEGLKLHKEDGRRMRMYVRDVRHIDSEIAKLEKLVTKEALQSEDAQLIMSLMGFGAFSALLVATTISGIDRFANPKKLVSFMGLCPRVYQSGNTVRYGRMKKSSNRNLTWIMVHAALMAVRYDPRMSARFETLRKRHPPLIAYSHVANYLAKTIWYMLTRREPYRYHDKAAYGRKLKQLRAKSR